MRSASEQPGKVRLESGLNADQRREEKRRSPQTPQGVQCNRFALAFALSGRLEIFDFDLRPEWGPACGVEGLQLSTGAAGGQVHPALCAGEACGLLCFSTSNRAMPG